MSDKLVRISTIRALRALKARVNVRTGAAADYVDVAWAEEFNSRVPQINRLSSSEFREVDFGEAHDNQGNPLEVEMSFESFSILIDRCLIALGAPPQDLADLHSALGEEFSKSFHIIPKKMLPLVSVFAAIAFLLGVVGVSYQVVHEVVQRGLVAEMEAEAARKLEQLDEKLGKADAILQRVLEINDPHAAEGHSTRNDVVSHEPHAYRE